MKGNLDRKKIVQISNLNRESTGSSFHGCSGVKYGKISPAEPYSKTSSKTIERKSVYLL